MTPEALLRYWNTVRHLKARQWYRRFWFRWSRPRLERRPPPPRRVAPGAWVAPLRRPQRMFGPTTFRFLNRAGECASPADWNDPSRDRLWLYNLHYFDDLTADGAGGRTAWHQELVARWMKENPPARGVGWEPYPTSQRIVNWIKWARGGATPPPGFEDSLAAQVRWLARRVEWHLLANHLLANAKALVAAGLWFTGLEASRWLAQGQEILGTELAEQILSDGGHFERSPMYHNLVLEDVLDLINLGRASGAASETAIAAWCRVAERMLAWSEAMTHPDGGIAFFNDAAFGVAGTLSDLQAYAARLGISHVVSGELGESGYVRLERGAAVLIADLAPVGPDYQPGHAHADTLSFELSLAGQRLVVNSGTSTYVPGTQRTFERSTRAHSTVEIGGLSSSETWGGFRVARRARVQDAQVEQSPSAALARARHDGYHRLSGKPTHHREWRLEDRALTVTDRIPGIATPAVARLYLHPSVAADDAGGLTLPDGRRCQCVVRGGTLRVAKAAWFPEFGRSQPNACLDVAFAGNELVTRLEW